MRNLRNRVPAFALAVVLASGMVTMFNTPVRAFDGGGPPTVADACANLASSEAALIDAVVNPTVKAVLQRLIDAAQARLGC